MYYAVYLRGTSDSYLILSLNILYSGESGSGTFVGLISDAMVKIDP